MDKKSEEYLRQYIKLTDTIKQKIEAHAARYHIKAEICAWYSDWEDFCSDWCDICGYSRTAVQYVPVVEKHYTQAIYRNIASFVKTVTKTFILRK